MGFEEIVSAQDDKPSDFIFFNGDLVISYTNGSIKVYSEHNLHKSIILPTSITKMCQFKNFLFCTSFSSGFLYIFNKEYSLIDVLPDFKKTTFIFSFGEAVYLITLDKRFIQIVKEENNIQQMIDIQYKTQYSLSEILSFCKSKHIFKSIEKDGYSQIVTCYCQSDNELALGLDNVLNIYDSNLINIFSNTYECTISSLSFFDQGILVGLNNGKIHCENRIFTKESFIFHAQYDVDGNKKVLYPVTNMFYNKYLFTSGGNGKIIKWDLKKKSQMSTVLDNSIFVRKFLIFNDVITVMLDDPLNGYPSKILYSAIKY